MSKINKQKCILEYLFKDNDNLLIPKKNIFTLNIPNISDNFELFKEDKRYDSLIDFYYEFITNKNNISNITNLNSHDGLKTNFISTKNKDINIYLFKGFDYNIGFNQHEKDEFTELFSFYDSLWDKRNEIYDDISNKLKRLLIPPISHQTQNEIISLKKILKIKETEDIHKNWFKTNDPNWDTLYKLDNLLRHGIDGKLGYLSDERGYDKAKELIKERKEQLEQLKKNNCSNKKISDKFINDEIEKLTENIKENGKYINPHQRNKEYVIDKCNKIQWSEEEEICDPNINKNNLKDLLYEFVNYDTKDDPPPSLPLNKRQYIYGFSENIEPYKKYKQYFRVAPYQDGINNCYYNLIEYSQLLNKLGSFCATNSDLLFPMRFILKNPYLEDRSLNKITKQINTIDLFKYTFIGMVSINRKIFDIITSNYKDISYNFFILKNETDKTNFNYIKGKFSNFLLIDFRLQIIDINTIFPLKNITWDEFNMVFKWLNKDIYYYKEDEINQNKQINFFVHNKNKYPHIPEELKKKIILFTSDSDMYKKFNITYNELYKQDLLTDSYIDSLFKNSSLSGGSKLFKTEYIMESYKKNNINLDGIIHNLIEKYNIEIGFKFNELFFLFDPYFLIHTHIINTNINNKISNIFFNIDDKINIRSFESLYIFNLINKNNMDILEINNYTNNSIYNCIFIANKNKISINCDTDLFTIYRHDSFNPYYDINNRYNNDIKNISSSNKINIFNDYITKDILINVNKKYDLICCNITSASSKLWFLIEEQSLNLKFIFIIYSLLRLNKNGNLIISYGDILTIQSYQIINNLIPYFDDIIIHNEEVKEKYKQTGTNIICKKFKNNFNITKFNKMIHKIFSLDNSLGNNLIDINENLSENTYNDDTNIYINDYSINKKDNQKLLNNIKQSNIKKHFMIIKNYYDVIFVINKFINSDNLRENIIKYYNSLRIVCSYMKGIEFDLINKNDIEILKPSIQEIIKKLKKNTIITKNIAIYKKMKSKYIIEELNIKKLKIIKEFREIMNNENNIKKYTESDIFNIINFNDYKENIYTLLENNKDLYISFDDDTLYKINLIYKKKDTYLLTEENKIFIDNILIKTLNEIIDIIYDKQTINYYLNMYKL